MQEEEIRYYLHHDTLGCCGRETIHYTSSDKAAMRLRLRFPDAGPYTQSSEDDAGEASTKDVGARDDYEIGVSKHDDRESRK